MSPKDLMPVWLSGGTRWHLMGTAKGSKTLCGRTPDILRGYLTMNQDAALLIAGPEGCRTCRRTIEGPLDRP